MIKENSQISLTMELEGSVLLRKDIKTKTVSLLKSFRDKKTGEIKPVLDKHGKIFDCIKDLYSKNIAVDITTVKLLNILFYLIVLLLML